jgi:hypothetical protein
MSLFNVLIELISDLICKESSIKYSVKKSLTFVKTDTLFPRLFILKIYY